ncbi:radical SAM family heme chaperone HemW [Streptomyces sp. YIM 98790]|uniref:radical SAM family heme chaperone HemW n=1 Tax=Streptomyces sp. YIM 98790 TaxID=2689077 RepID=UPI00140ADB9D|nr:radical SAM family heme chaperone HemW [Streptomyces sp. YIM 98790]
MPSAPPDGEPVPASGALPPSALRGAADRPLGFYLHVPYCATRCGYCDFNTYTPSELRSGQGAAAAAGAASGTGSRESYAAALTEEIRLARKVLGDDPRPARTVFFGGGTPTLLPAGDLVRMLDAVRQEFGLAPDAEITTEANPESVTPAYLAALRRGGFTRISFGMQSARAHVLRVLDRAHTPGRPEECVAEARAAGFEHINLDLIYGTPGESDDDWRASLEAALSAGPDHISAYSLIVEEGTRLARRIRRGEIPPTDEDQHADRYLIAEEMLSAAGFSWYEVSNWAASPAGRCLHNDLYWRDADWWGAGPGAHSHVGGTRWWNVRHPAAYAAALAAGRSPGAGRETLTAEDRRIERIMLRLRLSDGCPLTLLTPAARRAARQAVADGLLDPARHAAGQAVLTLRGRLLADAVIRDLTD